MALLVWSVQRTLFLAVKQHKATYTHEAQHRLRDLFLFVDASLLWASACGLSGVIGIAAWLLGVGPFVAIAIASLCLFVPKALLRFALLERHRQFERQLSDALFALSSAMRAGASFATALQALTQHALPPLSQEFVW